LNTRNFFTSFMSDLVNSQKQLAHFINFHSHAHASAYNTIEGIIDSTGLRENIKTVMGLLKKDFVALEYNVDMNYNDFLKNLLNYLVGGKTVFIYTNTLKLDPVVYDQLINFRKNNSFNLDLSNPISPEARIFFVMEEQGDQRDNKIYEIADHVLDLREEKV
jgi:hypothetical protein